jgi:hypothetical protein
MLIVALIRDSLHLEKERVKPLKLQVSFIRQWFLKFMIGTYGLTNAIVTFDISNLSYPKECHRVISPVQQDMNLREEKCFGHNYFSF